MKFGSTLHDIGKLGIPEHILNKPGRFTADAFDAMTSERPYRKQLMSKKEGFLALRRHSSAPFDSNLIEVFIQAVKLSSVK